jgi:hypothetical protein
MSGKLAYRFWTVCGWSRDPVTKCGPRCLSRSSAYATRRTRDRSIPWHRPHPENRRAVPRKHSVDLASVYPSSQCAPGLVRPRFAGDHPALPTLGRDLLLASARLWGRHTREVRLSERGRCRHAGVRSAIAHWVSAGLIPCAALSARSVVKELLLRSPVGWAIVSPCPPVCLQRHPEYAPVDCVAQALPF